MSALVPAFLADLFLRSALLLLLAWAAAAALRKAGGSAASRHLVWLLCLGALLLLPLLSLLLPRLELPVLPAQPQAAAAAVQSPMPSGAETVTRSDGAELAWAFYFLVAGLLGARLLLGRRLLALQWRQAREHEELGGRLDRLKARFGIRRPVQLRLRDGAIIPMTWGLTKPRILLPRDAERWAEERGRLVLLHELAHVSRFDSPVRLGAAIACALYWFQPGIWLAMRRMRIEQEHAADDLVLAAGAGSRSYACTLLESAGGRPAPAGLAAAMAAPSELESRLIAIVAQKKRDLPGRGFVAGSSAAALLAALLAATAIPVAASRMADPPASGPTRAPAVAASRSPAGEEPAAAEPAARRAVTRAAAAPVAAYLPPAEAVRPAAAPSPPADYPAMVEAYERDLDLYRRRVAIYHARVEEHHGQVAELRRQGNLGNSGNTGNSGNSGNYGNPGGPDRSATPPTHPTMPTMPTPPSPRYIREVPAVPAIPAVAPVPAQPRSGSP